jgi:nucleoside phosphorylase
MEGSGLLASAHRTNTAWILVKGICDWGFNKKDDCQKIAVQNAIKFVNFALEESVL